MGDEENGSLDEGSTVVESLVLVHRQFVDKDGEGDIEEEEKPLAVHKFVTEPALVRFEVGVTKNMGNYESARVTVGVTVPCYREEISEAYAYARSWAGKIISKEQEALETKGGAPSKKESIFGSDDDPF
jgi:hypothetical protein